MGDYSGKLDDERTGEKADTMLPERSRSHSPHYQRPSKKPRQNDAAIFQESNAELPVTGEYQQPQVDCSEHDTRELLGPFLNSAPNDLFGAIANSTPSSQAQVPDLPYLCRNAREEAEHIQSNTGTAFETELSEEKKIRLQLVAAEFMCIRYQQENEQLQTKVADQQEGFTGTIDRITFSHLQRQIQYRKELADLEANHQASLETAEASTRQFQTINEDLTSRLAESKELETKLREKIRNLEKRGEVAKAKAKKVQQIEANLREHAADLEAQIETLENDLKSMRKQRDNFRKRCEEATESKLRTRQVTGTYYCEDTIMINAWKGLHKGIRSLSVKLAGEKLVSTSAMCQSSLQFLQDAKQLSLTWSKIFEERPQSLICAVIWRHLTLTMFAKPLQLWAGPKAKQTTEFLKDVDLSSDEKIKKANHCRGLIGQLQVANPNVKINAKLEAAVTRPLTQALAGILEEPQQDALRPMVKTLVERALSICKEIVQCTTRYEVLQQRPGGNRRNVLAFDGKWMDKTLDNLINPEDGVDLMLCPGLARLGGLDAENWSDCVVMVKAEVMAEDWRELQLGS